MMASYLGVVRNVFKAQFIILITNGGVKLKGKNPKFLLNNLSGRNIFRHTSLFIWHWIELRLPRLEESD
jgi:hypothetical protein